MCPTEANQPLAMGWIPDLPDIRDYRADSTKITPHVERLKSLKKGKSAPAAPTAVDLRAWCAPIEDQETIGSCTAHAGVGMVEYFERRAFGKHLDASRLFLYKATRNLLHWTGDTGAYLRTTMKALTLFGVPPEEYWPYKVAKYEVEPTAFCYAFGQNYQAIQYYRLDPPGSAGKDTLASVKSSLASGLPAMFGFTVYNSISQAAGTGKIPFPLRTDKVAGGHAVLAVGYDDKLEIKHTGTGATATKGALLIRNSWGTGWGDAGYGWLPYQYMLDELALDWWTIMKTEWIDTGMFD